MAKKNVENADKILFTSVNKVWVSLHRFSRNARCTVVCEELAYRISWKSNTV